MRIPQLSTENFSRFTLEDFYNEHESKSLIDLSSATLPALSIQDLLTYYTVDKQETILNSILSLKLGYSEQYGSELIRQKLTSLYPNLQQKNFLISSGASEAIYIVFSTLFQAGDTIVVQRPIYQSLYQVAKDHGVQIIDWFYEQSESFENNFSNLKKIFDINSNIKGLVINNPNSPTGIALDNRELKQIIYLIKKQNSYLIADEVFRGLNFKAISSVVELYDRAIAIADLSKAYSMPGLRLGWIAAHEQKLLEMFSAYKNYLSLRSSTLSEALGYWVLEAGISILEQNRKTLKTNIDYLFQMNSDIFSLEIGREAIQAPCVFARKKELFDLSQKQGFLIVDGSFYGQQYQDYFRLGLRNIKSLPQPALDH